MKKVFVILPDKHPYSLCAKSFAQGFEHLGYYVGYEFSSQIDNNLLFNFSPDILICFDFSELNEGLLFDIKNKKNDTIFIFNFLTSLNLHLDKKSIENLKNFDANKIIFTVDKSNIKILPEAMYISNSINYKKYKSSYSGYSKGITLLSNPDNINVLKVITDLISEFGQISIYADEIDYVNSLDNELWNDIDDISIKELYKKSYCFDIIDEKSRAKVLSSSFITVVPITQTLNGIDFRILEACASSSFVICEESPEIIRLFDSGKEIETYKNTFELIDKIKFYLKNPSIARKIADNSRSTAVNNHNVFDTVRKISDIIDDKFGK
ncbi:glycosyltransferase family 1 protein [bacterium]|nr:glycosyltransferase family 1 protein [bacterium]